LKALVFALLLAAPAAAVRPLTPPAPEFPEGAVWINATRLTLGQMRGRKVALVAFLNPAGLHSLRLLPALNALFDRYALSQLMVVGVITPDFEFQKDPAWTRRAAARLAVEFPLIIDGDRRLWKAYANDGWPTVYLIDRKGRIIFDHLGEGGYDEMEHELREALADVASDIPEAAQLPELPAQACGHATADVSLGGRRKGSTLEIDRRESRSRILIMKSREGEVSAAGEWEDAPDGMRLTRNDGDLSVEARVIYSAAQAAAVLAPPGRKPARFFVKLDDQWLFEGVAGKDIAFDDDGRSFVSATEARLYDLARTSDGRLHELTVIPEKKNSSLDGFAFADRCSVTDLK
jgi:hypothetical protein